MGKLNPNIKPKGANGDLYLFFDVDPDAAAYVVDTPTKKGVLAGKAKAGPGNGVKLTNGPVASITASVAPAVAGAMESASYPSVVPPPPNVVEVHTLADLLKELSTSHTSDVFVRSGLYGKVVIPQPCNGRTIFGEAGTVLQGIYDEFGGYHLRDITSRMTPGVGPTGQNDDNPCTYLHGTCANVFYERVVLQGGSWCVKCYASGNQRVKNVTFRDCTLSGASEDLTHWDGVDVLLLDHNLFKDPTKGLSQEHHDMIQIQVGTNWVISRNEFDWLKDHGSGGDDLNEQAIFLNEEGVGVPGRVLGPGQFVNNLIHTTYGKRGIQALNGTGGSLIAFNTILTEDGDSWGGITVGANMTVVNNICNGIGVQGGSGSDIAGNWITSGSQAGSVAGTGNAGLDATFHPASGSPVVGKAVSRSGLPVVDRDGFVRNQAAIGCYV